MKKESDVVQLVELISAVVTVNVTLICLLMVSNQRLRL